MVHFLCSWGTPATLSQPTTLGIKKKQPTNIKTSKGPKSSVYYVSAPVKCFYLREKCLNGTEKGTQYLSLPDLLKVNSGMWALHITFYYSFVFVSKPLYIMAQSLEMVKGFVGKPCLAVAVIVLTLSGNFFPGICRFQVYVTQHLLTCPARLREPWHNGEKVT